MSLIRKMRRQSAVYWEKTGVNDRGRAVYAAPVQILVRWDDGIESSIAPGRTITSRATVYVAEDMPLGSVLWLGAIADLTEDQQSSPLTVPGAYEIRNFMKTPNIRATESLRIAVL